MCNKVGCKYCSFLDTIWYTYRTCNLQNPAVIKLKLLVHTSKKGPHLYYKK